MASNLSRKCAPSELAIVISMSYCVAPCLGMDDQKSSETVSSFHVLSFESSEKLGPSDSCDSGIT